MNEFLENLNERFNEERIMTNPVVTFILGTRSFSGFIDKVIL